MREAAHVALARAHLDGGDRTAALLALRRGEEVMRAELGVPLSPATVAFRREVLKSLETS
jgi:DNA-binding SARP family transcriptional activator